MVKEAIYKEEKSIEDILNKKLYNPIKLNSNEFPYPPSKEVKEAIQKYDSCRLSFYPEKNPYHLTKPIGDINKIHPECILLGAGSSQIISIAIASLVDKEGELIIPTHAFQLYKVLADYYKRKAILIDETKSWEQDLDSILNAITSQTQMIFLVNPSNPLGTWINKKSLLLFLERIPKSVTVLIDEAYFDFMEGEASFATMVQDCLKHNNVLVVRTFSKLYGLAALRIGYAVANPRIIDRLKSKQMPFSVNQIAIQCASEVLKSYKYYQFYKSQIIQTRLLLFDQLSQLGFKPLANSANFLTINFGQNASRIVEKLEENNIYVAALKNYNLENYIRITVGTHSEVQAFLKHFVQLL